VENSFFLSSFLSPSLPDATALMRSHAFRSISGRSASQQFQRREVEAVSPDSGNEGSNLVKKGTAASAATNEETQCVNTAR
jgi:hypothetical protein